jgi:hypothetical protein
MNSGSAVAATASAAPAVTRVPQSGAWTGAENKNPAEHTPEKTNNDPEAIAAGTANASSDDKAKDKANDDTFAKCPPEEKSEATKTQEERQATTENTAASEDATLTDEGAGNELSSLDQIAELNNQDLGGGAGREIKGTATLTDSEGSF